ncbi:ankyrin repeat domain-containing protein [Aspergillus affinis]|uniref:ankyrin repeat domain-containing protein n=1 Tax=Aspergillus affinis TaxID=1070780 RepID=UPI0022FE0C3A|nr:uncharacterized protein KD926_008356 [Aspergillus affinis]KAI9040399.1 hypothetical protein KD926_008356 [Aspergillus affinis]
MIYRRLTEGDQILKEMESVLLDESSEMFLWVYLQIEILWDTCITDAEIRRALASLSKDLEETYRRFMNRINLQDRRIIMSLTWANFAVRPLHIDGFREAVAFTAEDTAWDKGKSLESSIPELREAFQDVDHNCGQLCISYLSFSDFSLQLDKPIDYTVQLKAPDASLLAATLTGSQLVKRLFPKTRFQQASIPLPIRSIRPYSICSREQYKFLNYTTENWARHTKNLKASDFLWEKFPRLALTINESWNIHLWNSGRSQLSHTHALFGWAVKEHHVPLLQLVTGLESAIDQISNLPLLEENIPALHLASKIGYDEVVEIILPACDKKKLDMKGIAPLHYAAMKGNLLVALRLSKIIGIELDVRSKYLETPLWLAVYQGWEDIVVMLLFRGADIELSNLEGRTPPMVASAAGHVAIVNPLIRNGANTSRPDLDEIAFAIEKSYPEAIASMLRKGLDPDTFLHQEKPDQPGTLLAWAAGYRQKSLAQLLIDKGASVNLEDENGWTALTFASSTKGQSEIAELLIHHGALVKYSRQNMLMSLLERPLNPTQDKRSQ